MFVFEILQLYMRKNTLHLVFGYDFVSFLTDVCNTELRGHAVFVKLPKAKLGGGLLF